MDIYGLSLTAIEEIADYLHRDNIDTVNSKVASVKPKNSFYTRYCKRFFDIIIALVGLIITSPINLVIAIVTYFDVGRPIIFKQKRRGKNGSVFTIYKFRNMTNETDANGELLPPSERVTKWGKFVRRTSLDELLNFVSILNGSMSVVGPRPLPEYQLKRLNNRHLGAYTMRPGLECPTPNKVDHDLTWEERLENYVWYAENCSFLVDIKLMFRIVQITFEHRSTKQRSEARSKVGGMLGYDRDGNVICTTTCPERYVEEYCLKHGYSDFNDAVAARAEARELVGAVK